MEANVSLDEAPAMGLKENYSFCSPSFREFWADANDHIIVLNLLICSISVLLNSLNVIVFTRKSMLNPTNVLLACIAGADLVVAATYVPQYVALVEAKKKLAPYYGAVAWILHEYFLAVFHHISIWLTTTLAIWRYVAVVHPFHSKQLCTMTRVMIVIAVVVVFNLLVTIPGYVDVSIVESDETKSWKEGGCDSKYCAKWKPINFLRKIEFIYQTISKIVPSAILTFVSVRLIYALSQRLHARRRMRAASNAPAPPANKLKELEQPQEDRKEFDKTTNMLLAVLLLFLCSELPPSIIVLLEVFLDQTYYFECRRPVHYFLLFLYYLSGCFNFVVYVVMSRNYRLTLFTKVIKVPVVNNTTTVNMSELSSTSKARSHSRTNSIA